MKKTFLSAVIIFVALLVLTACDNGDGHLHEWSSWSTLKSATCTEDGIDTRECACGEIEKREIAATGHVTGEWVTVKDATRTEDGERRLPCAVCRQTLDTEVLYAGSVGLEYKIFDTYCTVSGIGSCEDTDIVIPQ